MHLGTRSLTLTVGGVSRTADVSDCRIVSQPVPDDERALCESTREYRLLATAAQDPSPGSLWDLVWSTADEEVEVEVCPAGGSEPTETQPWFAGTVVISEPVGDLLGGRADASPTNKFTFGIDWRFTAKPSRLTDLTESWS